MKKLHITLLLSLIAGPMVASESIQAQLETAMQEETIREAQTQTEEDWDVIDTEDFTEALKNEKKELQKEIEDLRIQADADILSLQETIENLTIQNEINKRVKKDLDTQLLENIRLSQKQSDNKDKQIQILLDIISQKDAEIILAEKTNHTLQEQIEFSQVIRPGVIETAHNDTQELNDALEQAHLQIVRLENEITHLKSIKTEDASTSYKEEEDKIVAVDTDKLMKQFKTLQYKNESLTAEIAELNKNLEQTSEVATYAQKEAQRITKQANKLKESVNNTHQILQEEENEHTQLLIELNQEISALKDANGILQEIVSGVFSSPIFFKYQQDIIKSLNRSIQDYLISFMQTVHTGDEGEVYEA